MINAETIAFTAFIGLIVWLALWPVTLICGVVQYFIGKTEGKYNGVIIPVFMFIFGNFFTLLTFVADSPPNMVEKVVFFGLTLLVSAIIPLAMYWLYYLVHDNYIKTKYKRRDEDIMKIHDL